MDDEQRKKLEATRAALREVEAELAGGNGKPLEQIAAAHRNEEELATLYDRMSSAELMELYSTSKDEWQKIIHAKENSGLKKLMGRR
jgi:hypothetical protein